MASLVRQKQLALLKKALGSEEQPVTQLPPVLFVWGHGQSGKGQVVDEAVQGSGITRLARVNALEILCGLRPFLQTILEQLFRAGTAGQVIQSRDTVTSENFNSFLQQIQKCSCTEKETDRMIVVIDEADKLIKAHSDLLYVFINCQELTGRRICVILNSSLPLTAYSNIQQMRLIPTIHFSQFSKAELCTILKSDPPSNLSDLATYEFFITTFLEVHYTRCRELKRLRRMAHLQFAEHFLSKGSNPDVMVLWKNIRTMKREVRAVGTGLDEKSDLSNSKAAASHMPHYSKFMLIAAFLASQNPTSSDRRFFVTGRGIRKRKHGGTSVSVQPNPRLKQGLMFTHARLVSIFWTLVEHKCPVEAALMSHITTLCNSKLLSRIDDTLDDCKYRCNANLDFVAGIGDSIGFEVKPYIFHLG